MNSTAIAESASTRTMLISAFMVCTDVAVFFGNFLAVASFCINHKLHTVTNSFIVSMSVGDLLIALVCIPTLLVANLLGPNLSSDTGLLYCHVSLSITITLMIVAIGNLGLNSLDRYRAILYPLTYNARMTKRRVFWKIALAWIISIAFGFLPFFGWGRLPNYCKEGETLFCQVRANLSWDYRLTFLCISGIPFVLMGVAYWEIFKTARRHTKVIAADVARLQERKRVDYIKETRAAKLVGAILGAFMICYFPLFVAVVVDLSLSEGINPYVYVGVVLLGTVNSAINPFIVAAMNREYRQTYHRIVRCKWRKTCVQEAVQAWN